MTSEDQKHAREEEKNDKYYQMYYKLCNNNNIVNWALQQLRLLSDMLDPNQEHISFPPKIDWIKKEIDRVKDRLVLSDKELTNLHQFILKKYLKVI